MYTFFLYLSDVEEGGGTKFDLGFTVQPKKGKAVIWPATHNERPFVQDPKPNPDPTPSPEPIPTPIPTPTPSLAERGGAVLVGGELGLEAEHGATPLPPGRAALAAPAAPRLRHQLCVACAALGGGGVGVRVRVRARVGVRVGVGVRVRVRARHPGSASG